MNRREIHAGEAIGVKTNLENSELIRYTLNQRKMLDKTKNPLLENENIIWPALYQNLVEAEAHLSSIAFDYELGVYEFFRAPPPIDPHTKLGNFVRGWVAGNNRFSEFDMSKNIPKKWEILGHIGLLAKDSFEQKFLDVIFDMDKSKQMDFWNGISESLNVEKLGIQQHIADDEVRSSKVQLLNSEDGWTTFMDNGVEFTFDVTKVMFSSGNVTERHRVARMKLSGQTIVDCYAGVGYYSLHALKNGKADYVHACELNPNSVNALRKALELNNLNEKMTIHEGDNQLSLPNLKSVADRVFLGLLPSSEKVWELSVACLKDGGGVLHIHMNVEEEKLSAWTESTKSQILDYSQRLGRNFKIASCHLEKVKWFAPRVRHVVLDLELRP